MRVCIAKLYAGRFTYIKFPNVCKRSLSMKGVGIWGKVAEY